MHNGSDKPAEPAEKALSEPAKTSKLEKKIPDAPTETTRPVANVTGKAKTPGTNDEKKTVSEQILQKLAKSRPESKPQTGTSKPTKAEKTNTAQNHETDAGDSDEIIITHDGTKRTKRTPTEPANPNTKKRHTTVSKPAIVYEYKEANKTPQIPLERNKDATQPTRPVTKTKPQSMIPPLPPLSEVLQSPLKKAAVPHRMINGESEFAVIHHKNADTASLRQEISQEITKPDQSRVKAYSWEQLSETVNAPRSNSELSATELSLAERTGIGDDDTTTTPAREKHFRNTHYHQTVS